MKRLFPALLLGLASRSALAAAPPTVPATLDLVGLRLTLDDDARQLVQAKVNSLCRHQSSLDARVALAEAAFPLIDKVLAEEGVPTDFRYLALQESALQGNAESPHGAVGYWQLKRETALSLGLTVNGSIDERRHLTASTRAAARYLTRNNATLHNWTNALLSYYTGLGGVRAYTRPDDAEAHDMRFTSRTNQYLLDFVAQKVVFEPACAQQTVPFVPWREVPATAGQTLAQQAAALAVDPSTVAQLNPWLLAREIPEDGHAYTILVPLAAAPPVVAARPTPSPTPEDPDKALATVNSLPPEVPEPPVQPLPSSRTQPAPTPPVPPSRPVVLAPAPAPTPPAAARPDFTHPYLVAPGETLYGLARRVGVRPAELAAWNNLPPDAGLRAGQMLHLSPPAAEPVLAAEASALYTVAAGDTFYSIAHRYGCTVATLAAQNERTDVTLLHIGEMLRVPRL
ncbi:lytic transglycosylase domain-containing protein [Hymenobacter psoromatis]|uniref:lytic transglycosylase domain-containing protein n=1 Tax=Hymenobacter psoromatis TaxID=1484116 RepID=UPI001CBE3137|nr:lytic transglycosylase domain-containing protein [Hymenobacter psoromatis]